MVDEGKQPLSAGKQDIPGDLGVTVSLPGVSVDRISECAEIGAGMGLDLE